MEHSAAEAIAGLKLTNANYDEAVKILTERFGNKQVVINGHMEALMNLPTITNVQNVRGLRQLYDKSFYKRYLKIAKKVMRNLKTYYNNIP